ncbi:MAG: divergent polysaccharide deacetylase family protein [Desulfofustis sp.]|nr:divergent polysaccharide deacetylase family protein [Desulfofustis sp.]
MAQKTTRNQGKKSVRKSSGRRRAPAGFRFTARRLLTYGLLLLLLTISLSVAGYMIFFRVVVAAENDLPSAPSVLFEEPDLPTVHPAEPVVLPALPHPPKIAIIIDDMGYHRQIDGELLRLDLNLSFSFLPHAPYTKELEQEAYRLGRTVLLHLPLEPTSAQYDPGPGTLILAQSAAERQRLLEDNLLLVPHAVGVNNHMGSRFTADEQAMSELAALLARREMFFVDSMTTARSRGAAAAEKQGVPTVKRDVFLDNQQQETLICRQLELLVTIGRWQGSAVGIGHPYPETLAALATCGRELLDGVELVGVDQLVGTAP